MNISRTSRLALALGPEQPGARSERRWRAVAARTAAAAVFLADPLWWTIGLVGLLGDMALRLAAPALLATSALHGAMQWFSCLLSQPVLEEVTFRGILQRELLRTRWGRYRALGLSAANVICSMAFVSLHLLHHPPLWALSVFAPSLVLGWLRERHSSVASPIAMHILFNLTFFAAASLGA